MTCYDTNYKMKSLLLSKLLRQRFHRKQPKIHDVLYVAGIQTQDPRWAWQTRDALDLMSNYFVSLTCCDLTNFLKNFVRLYPLKVEARLTVRRTGKFCQNVDVALALKEVQSDVKISLGGVGGCVPIEIALFSVLRI